MKRQPHQFDPEYPGALFPTTSGRSVERVNADLRCAASRRVIRQARRPMGIAPAVRTAPRARGAGRPRAASRSSARSGDSGDDSGPSSDGEPPGGSPFASDTRRDQLVRDVADYLNRVGPQGAERDWLAEQVCFLGHPADRVRAAISLLAAQGLAQATHGEASTVRRAA